MEYIVHIFDVDNKGSIIGATEQITVIYAETDDQAIEIAERLRKDRNEKEPLPENKEWGKVEWLVHVIKNDKVII